MSARKLKRPLPPTRDPGDRKPPPPIELREGKPKVGRPSNEERAKRQAETDAKQAEARAAAEIKPDEIRPLTAVVLVLICKGVKGDTPTAQEIELVNGPACAVANKYAMTNRWAPELALLGSIMIVAQMSRNRRAQREHSERVVPIDRAQTVNQPQPEPAQ